MHTRKRFGQHFLEPSWVRKVLDVVAPTPRDVFLEIGPGQGALTFPLARLVHEVVAVEIDRDLAARLARSAPANVRIVTADFLRTDVRALLSGGLGSDSRAGSGFDPTRVVGNLPYNISSPILFRLLSLAGDGRFLADATLMLQREVADRIVARPGSGDYGILSILVQLHTKATRSLLLPPGAFRPAPRVSSAVVHLAFTPPVVAAVDPPLLEQMVRMMFTQRRKTLANALRGFAETRGVQASEAVAKAGVEPSRRPETLDLGEIARLSDVFASASRPDVL